MGQAEGGFVMGLGYFFNEKVKYDSVTGQCLTNGTWEYKPPSSKDIPVEFNVKFYDQSKNDSLPGILGAKVIGEPPLCLAPCAAFAVKKAIEAARNEIGQDNFFTMNSPFTVDDVQQYCLVDYNQFKLKD